MIKLHIMKHSHLKETQKAMDNENVIPAFIVCHSSLSGIVLKKDAGQASMTKGGFSDKSYSGKLFTIHCPPPHPPLSKGGRRGGSGFTLIETIMVMVIIAILAAVVIIRNPFGDIKLYSATRKVAADIRYVQKLSISNQTRAGITFVAGGYSVYRDMTGPYLPATSPGDPCSTDPSNYFVVDFNDSRCSNYSSVTISTSPLPLTIAFNSLGTPVAADGTALGPQTVTINYNGSQQITITAGTGRVSY